MKINYLTAIVVLSLLVIPFTGCSSNVQLTGTVVFDDDGSPITEGVIIFTDGTHAARGTIESDGSFRMGFVGTNDGLPPGEYTVHFWGVQATGPAQTITTVDAMGNVVERELMSTRTPLIHPRYERPETSGLQVEVNRQTRTMDFRLTRP